MEKKRTILIADDEAEIRKLVRIYLEKDGYLVLEAADGAEAFNQLEKADLLILDIMMPKIDGISILRKMRTISNIPVIILSAKSANCDRILGLDLGADDYIVKPFDPLELVARVSANLRRFYRLGSKQEQSGTIVKGKDLELDLDACVIRKEESVIELTGVEFKILKLLMENQGRVFTKQQIYEAGWEEMTCVDDNSIMVCISKIRAKLEDTNGNYIRTVRGLGYCFEK